jgi:hypothetical protein
MAKITQAQIVAAQLAAVTEQNFKFLMARFDNIEQQNGEQLTLLRAHIEKDEAVHKIVERHSTYFGILSLGIPVGIASFMHKMGWKAL